MHLESDGVQHQIPEHKNWEKTLHQKYLRIILNVESHKLKCTYGNTPHQKSFTSPHYV